MTVAGTVSTLRVTGVPSGYPAEQESNIKVRFIDTALEVMSDYDTPLLKRLGGVSQERVALVQRLEAEARMTLLDGCLATGILAALVLNAAIGLWWADPAAAAVVGLFCLREAVDNWRDAH